MPKIKVNIPASLVASFCAPCVAAEQQAATAATTDRQSFKPRITVRSGGDRLASAPAAPPEASAPVPLQGNQAWNGVLAIEGELTGDGRIIVPGALTWDTLPLILRWCPIDNGSHDGAIAVGLIETLERDASTGQILASGTIDANTPDGAEAARRMGSGLLSGVSVDLDDMQIQVMVPETQVAAEQAATPPAPDANGMVTVYEGDAAMEQLHITSARLRAATLVDIPAFAGAKVQLGATTNTDAEAGMAEAQALVATGHVSLTAAALPIPVDPPAAWFADPKFKAPTPLTFTDDGRVFGHIAQWETCHTGFPGHCVKPPRGGDYRLFNVGVLRTREGSDVSVGHITMDTGHAGPRLAAAPALAHYDNTGTCVADVHAGEDKHGIWIAGALRSSVTPERLRALRSSPMSGDWRTLRGRNLELLAVLAVNLPGFPVPRGAQALVASGAVTSLQLPIDINASGAPMPIPDTIIVVGNGGAGGRGAQPGQPGKAGTITIKTKAV